MVAAPSNLTYGTVVGTYFLTTLDGGDADRNPDYLPAIGTVTFQPEVKMYKNLAVPATIITAPITATIDAFGDLRDAQGGLGVVLMATDNVDLQPKNWTYTVTVSASGQVTSFPITVTGGSTIDLTIVAPVATSSGTAVVVSSADRIAAQAAAAAAAQSAIDAATAAAGGGGGLSQEQIQDMISLFETGSGYIQITYNDAANSLVVGTTTAFQTLLDSKATLASPVFTGNPTAPTPTAGDNDTSIATTAFVVNAISAKANLASPALTGTPTAPTATAGDATTTVATTAFVTNAVSTKANLASPALTGNPTSPTPAAGDNDTSIATTAFVTGAVTPSADDDNLVHMGTDGRLHVNGANLQPAGAYVTAASLRGVPWMYVIEAGQTETSVPADWPVTDLTAQRFSVIGRKLA